MHLGREIPVQGADGDIGSFGDGAHLHRFVAALGGDGQGGVQDALATLALSARTEVVVG
ncbi:Uncharacterised protein [Mycobacteroides abscessus subsp. abscessus]|nr:Uncharacterised protein [Mycobacteroides abscessus subsp. abscessus]